MKTPFQQEQDARDQFASMELHAGFVASVLIFTTVAASIVLRPPLLFVAGALGAGVAYFFSWKATLARMNGRAGAFALGGLLLAAGSANEVYGVWPKAHIILVGLSSLGLGLYGSLAATKARRRWRAR